MEPLTRELAALDAARWRMALSLTAVAMAIYFGFILLVAYGKPLLARLIVPGLSVGIALGSFVIVSSWVLIWIYVRWANRHYDAAIDRLRAR
ncbi:MAG TPA: DUF485 domain-containing protein [Vicinamibacterales bacterium]|jgi:uncharacterized membrane protein (DUF485 family)|nr:DUF485 domain-containing protein [Vicinamibacterales bacterium]